MRCHLPSAACLMLCLTPPLVAAAQANVHLGDEDTESGRDFPKTLTLDEPGIDDEVSLPTFVNSPSLAGRSQRDVLFELDKRLTQRLELQVNGGYRLIDTEHGGRADGWTNTAITAKFVAVDAPASETILAFGVAQELGRTGARRIGAAQQGAATPLIYFGQGLGAAPVPAALRPFAMTGTLGYVIADQARTSAGEASFHALQIGTSLQYSLRALPPRFAPGAFGNVVPLVEFTCSLPTTSGPFHAAREVLVAPGLIYAGGSYQLAAEALLPLSQASGHGLGVIAQLNLGFSALGLESLKKILF
jgi:hypothetical protein